MTKMGTDLSIETVQELGVVPRILDIVCNLTGMGFAAIARVTDTQWICCASQDKISFGLGPGGELELESTICHEVRAHRNVVVIPDVQCSVYVNHHTPARYGFRSYISVPIVRKDGSFFGTLCAIDSNPAPIDTPAVIETFKLFSDLIAEQLDASDRAAETEANLENEQTTASLREQFIAVLGHDLRNPLASIIAGLRLLPKHAPNDVAISLVSQMNQSAMRMVGLIDNTLDFARGRLGGGLTLQKEVQSITPILTEVVGELRIAHLDRSIDLQIACQKYVNCDGGRLAQLLSNLVGNALTHGATDQFVRVTAETANGRLRLSVANSGKKIPDEQLSKLFAPFSRGAVKNSLQGLGLGLFISQEIARAHGGEVSVKSTDAETRFTFEMPLE